MNLSEAYYRLVDYMNTGGPVMIPLAMDSLALWFLVIDRMLFFTRLSRKNMDLATAVRHVRENRLPDPDHYRGVVSLLVAEFISRRAGSPDIDRFVLDEAVMKTRRLLCAHLTLLGVLAAIAPLLGLLGTVMGMVTTFNVLAVHGTGNARAVAAGISEALVTTQTGLMIAIPGIYMKNILERKAGILRHRLSVTGFYIKRHLGS